VELADKLNIKTSSAGLVVELVQELEEYELAVLIVKGLLLVVAVLLLDQNIRLLQTQLRS
jgi:hypothetical protein